MKTQIINSLKQLNENDLDTLTEQVQETLATNVNLNNKGSLKAIDFWYIQRIQKSRSCGRFPSISVR